MRKTGFRLYSHVEFKGLTMAHYDATFATLKQARLVAEMFLGPIFGPLGRAALPWTITSLKTGRVYSSQENARA